MNNKKLTKEKRPTLAEENKTLKDSMKSLQDENTNLSQDFHRIDKENAVMNEKLSGLGWRDFCKNIGWLGIGSAITAGIGKQYKEGLIIAIISSFLFMIFSLYDSFNQKKQKVTEKV